MSTEGAHAIDPHDSFGKKVGLQAAIPACLLNH